LADRKQMKLGRVHEVPAVGYDDEALTVVSWGRLYKMTWAALDRYCEEVEVAISADWADSDLSPSGIRSCHAC
jgi:hypothetical protein